MQCIVRPCVVSREIGNLSLSRILKLTKGRMIYAMISVTSRNTAAEEEMLRIFIKGQLRKDHIAIILLTSTTIDLTRNMVTMKSSTRRFTILWNGIWEILLYYFTTLRSKLRRDWLRVNGNPRSVRCETCSQSYIMPHEAQ